MDGATHSGGAPAAAFLEAGHGLPFAGIITFARAEHRPDPEGAELAVLGVPFDLGTINRSGTRFGPQAIRRQTAYAGALQPVYPWEERLDVARLVDLGDVAPVPGSGAVEQMLAETEAAAARVLAAGASLLTLGGDHTIPYGPVRAASAAFGPVGLIHLDAHQDSLDSSTLPGRTVSHGTFATDLVNEGHVDPTRSVQLYIRTTMANPAGHTIVHADEAIDLGPGALAERVRGIVGDGPVYLTIDVDAIDPAFAPGCGSPCPGGPTSREVRRFLHDLAGIRVVAADIVEVCPPFDPGETTAVLAAFLGLDLLHLLAAGRRA